VNVGDLVKCHGKWSMGIIVDKITVEGWNKGHCYVLCVGRSTAWPFRPDQLELISECR
jgi:hypothetical protein